MSEHQERGRLGLRVEHLRRADAGRSAKSRAHRIEVSSYRFPSLDLTRTRRPANGKRHFSEMSSASKKPSRCSVEVRRVDQRPAVQSSCACAHSCRCRPAQAAVSTSAMGLASSPHAQPLAAASIRLPRREGGEREHHGPGDDEMSAASVIAPSLLREQEGGQTPGEMC